MRARTRALLVRCIGFVCLIVAFKAYLNKNQPGEFDTTNTENANLAKKANMNGKLDASDETKQLLLNRKQLNIKRQFKSPVDCSKIIDFNSKSEIKKADELTMNFRNYRDQKIKDDELVVSKQYLEDLKMIPSDNFIFDESQCPEFINTRGYFNYTVTDEEKAFPIAFSILTYKEAEQFERMLHAIYRPQNVYCIHVDAKSAPAFQQAIKSITQCFPNVFIATKLEEVYWGGYGRLNADINCMRDLLMASPDSKLPDDAKSKENVDKFWAHPNMKGKKFRTDWKYLENLASTEFPLRTNRELVQILALYNGTNDIEMIEFPRHNHKRIEYVHVYNKTLDKYFPTDKRKSPPPFNYTVVKGKVFASFSRPFIEFALNSVEARAYLKWLQDTYIPDESYWGTLQYNVQFNPPGIFKTISSDEYLEHMSRFVGWVYNYKCAQGSLIRNDLCMFTNGDLAFLSKQPHFFLNKFQLKHDPIAYACMEDWYSRRHQRENDLTAQGETNLVDMTPYCEYLHKMSGGQVHKGC